MKRLINILLFAFVSTISFGQGQGFFGNGTRIYTRQHLITYANSSPSTNVATAETGVIPVPFDVVAPTIIRTTGVAKWGTQSYQHTVDSGQAVFAGGRRTEFNQFDELLGTGYTGYERWVGFAIYIPPGWVFETNNILYNIMQQWHDYPTGAETEYKSAFEFLLDNNKWSFTVRACDNETSTSFFEMLGDDSSFSPTTNPTWGLSNPTIVRGAWTNVVIHTIFQDPISTNPNKNAARAEVWINDVKCLNYTGKMGYHHVEAPFFKIGDYAWFWNPDNMACCGLFVKAGVVSRTHNTDNIRIGNASATYNDVTSKYPWQ